MAPPPHIAAEATRSSRIRSARPAGRSSDTDAPPPSPILRAASWWRGPENGRGNCDTMAAVLAALEYLYAQLCMILAAALEYLYAQLCMILAAAAHRWH
eukprot:5392848-Pleurochrysis_carterae.AAC.3